MWFEHIAVNVLNRFSVKKSATPPPGLLLGTSANQHQPASPVVLTDQQRVEHIVVIGKTGSGKTRCLEAMARGMAKKDEGFAFFDFHGDASLSLITRLLSLPRARERLVVLDPSHPTHSPGINVLASDGTEGGTFRKVSELSSILRQRWGVDSFGARTEELLRNSLYTLADAGRPFGDLPRLLTNVPFRSSLTERLDHPDVRAYWRERFEPLSDAMKGAFREPLLNKVTGFLAEPGARHLLSQAKSTIDMDDVMAKRQWLIIRLPKGRLREHAHTIGNLLFAQLQFATFARERLPQQDRHLFSVICDESQNLAENHNGISSLISEARKLNVSFVSANQFWTQMPVDLRGPLLSAGSHVCFRLSSADAQVLAPELSLERRQQTALDLTTLERGEAVARISGAPTTRLRVPKTPDVEPVSSEEFDRLIGRVTRARTQIEHELRRPARPSSEDSEMEGPDPETRSREGHDDW